MLVGAWKLSAGTLLASSSLARELAVFFRNKAGSNLGSLKIAMQRERGDLFVRSTIMLRNTPPCANTTV